MSGVDLLSLWRAESRKLLSRALGRLGLVVAVLIGLAGPLWIQFVISIGAEFNGQNVAEMIEQSGANALIWVVSFRNLFIMRLLLVALAGLIFAGEFQARTLRDDLVRPVPRWSILVAKWAALSTWLAIGVALSWLTGMVLGVILFGTGGEWGDAVKAMGVSLLCDVGFGSLALAAAVWVRSTVGTLLGMMAFIALDTFAGFVLWALESVGQMAEAPAAVEAAIQARPWLPSAAFGVWSAWAGGEPWTWQNFVALALYTGLGLALAILRFHRMDVP